MIRFRLSTSLPVALAACLVVFFPNQSLAAESKEISFKTVDDIIIYGDLYALPDGKAAPLILQFHQAGRNARAEYGPLVSRLLDKGFNVLAIDQRSGGTHSGLANRTAENLDGKEYSYCEAYPDLEAALLYALEQEFSGKKIVWGSSYSAALVVQLAAKHSDQIDGVLAFSPASSSRMADCLAGPYLEDLKVPFLALRPEREMAIESTQRQAEAIRHHGHRFYVANNGVHGSSMLNPEFVEGSVEKHWEAVLSFIDEVLIPH